MEMFNLEPESRRSPALARATPHAWPCLRHTAGPKATASREHVQGLDRADNGSAQIAP